MENNNSKEFDFETYNDIMNKIKAGSPVHKINFSIESLNAIAGMYLATAPNIQLYLKNLLDLADVEDNTLLVFESRHVVECCQIIYGYLYIMDNLKVINFSSNFIIDKIMNILLKRPVFYNTMIIEMDQLADSCVRLNSDKSTTVLNSFKYILENIWFLPYGEMDRIAKTAIDEFKKQSEGDKNNEGNGDIIE